MTVEDIREEVGKALELLGAAELTGTTADPRITIKGEDLQIVVTALSSSTLVLDKLISNYKENVPKEG